MHGQQNIKMWTASSIAKIGLPQWTFKFYLPILNANGRKTKEPGRGVGWRGGGALDVVKRSNEMSLNQMELYCAFIFWNTEECARLQHGIEFFLERLVH